MRGTDDDFDAILFPQQPRRRAPAKAGYPSIVVPGGLRSARYRAPVVNPTPFGVTFSGRPFSEPRLIGSRLRFEQATKHRQSAGEHTAVADRRG